MIEILVSPKPTEFSALKDGEGSHFVFDQNPATGALNPKGSPVNSSKTGFTQIGGEIIYE